MATDKTPGRQNQKPKKAGGQSALTSTTGACPKIQPPDSRPPRGALPGPPLLRPEVHLRLPELLGEVAPKLRRPLGHRLMRIRSHPRIRWGGVGVGEAQGRSRSKGRNMRKGVGQVFGRHRLPSEKRKGVEQLLGDFGSFCRLKNGKCTEQL